MSPGEMLPGPMSQGLTCQAQLNFCQVKFWLGLGFDCLLWNYIFLYIWSRAVPIKNCNIIQQFISKSRKLHIVISSFSIFAAPVR